MRAATFHFQIMFGKTASLTDAVLEGILEEFTFPQLALRIAGIAPAAVWKALNKFPTAHKLKVEDTPEILSFLGTPIEQDGTLYWNLPQLKILQIEEGCCAAGEEILQMMQSRKGRHRSASPAPKLLPSPLETLIIAENCPMDRVTFMKLKTILPEADVIWKGQSRG